MELLIARPCLQDDKRRMDDVVGGVFCLLSGSDDMMAIVDAPHLFPSLNGSSIDDAPEIPAIKVAAAAAADTARVKVQPH